MAEATTRAVSWSKVPCIGEAHMMHICWIWQVLVPLHRPAITQQIAAELWMIFRAACRVAQETSAPMDPPKEVQAMQRWANELWLLYIQAN